MPEVVRGSRVSLQQERGAYPPSTPNREPRNVHFSPESHPALEPSPSQTLSAVDTGLSTASGRKRSREYKRRRSQDEPERDAYYDSRAATKKEFRRRASTLQEYYAQNPTLLPQLPFTWRYGWRRWKLFFTIFIMVVDACVVPIVLYYTMTFAGNVEGWIVFAVVATIWGGPTYVEFAVRSWRLIKPENFFRPLGTSNRWAFDITHWILVLTITAVTALLIVGSAPHIVWLRVLSMPGPAILFCLGGSIFIITMWSLSGRKAPFRISSTPKGGDVYPGVYYIIEDIVAVNANAGRPYREALAARYNASPRFRRMIKQQSLFWSIPSLVVAIACTVVVVIHPVPKHVAYGIGWGVPFFWAGVWTAIAIPWIRREMHKETVTWEEDCGIVPSEKKAHKKLDPNDSEHEATKEPEPEP
ncbi:uncharacterized protein Z518_02856 [Rhinocladiella mackenziei CBS 650.93]|uniref:Uncharacterized protein n=1 Tax=Rhinocladiella mackenziei CBS 650.93 TaxID=1442369 RepID=A0A0D2JFV6_9EURO|nr:uncharacterized protein Z518_02856 [Rhinocladiella mackenziei CBS 650.93]KIX08200.1 hypothetical protein Z518_02856 [Rhinocladiella mackenziei CBS 650.93]